jgi:hypothetical protein
VLPLELASSLPLLLGSSESHSLTSRRRWLINNFAAGEAGHFGSIHGSIHQRDHAHRAGVSALVGKSRGHHGEAQRIDRNALGIVLAIDLLLKRARSSMPTGISGPSYASARLTVSSSAERKALRPSHRSVFRAVNPHALPVRARRTLLKKVSHFGREPLIHMSLRSVIMRARLPRPLIAIF